MNNIIQFENVSKSFGDLKVLNNLNLEVKDGEKLALFNSADYLELAIFRSNLKTVGGASTLLGLEYRDRVTIDFFSEDESKLSTAL